MASSFDFRGLHCYAPAADGAPWTYLPMEPGVKRGADGQPLFTFADLTASAYLLLTAHWGAQGDDVSALRVELSGHDPAAQLTRASLLDIACHALVADECGGFAPRASSATSRVPPYDAVFNLYLQGDKLEHARAALQGRRGHLAIEYRATRLAAVRARATFTASGTTLGDFWRAHEGEGSAAEVLERAVMQGIAHINIDAPDPYADALAPDLHRRVLDVVAATVPQVLRRGAGADVRARVALEQDAGAPVRAFADLGAIFADVSLGSLTGGHHAAD
jgi:hypothetical protein